MIRGTVNSMIRPKLIDHTVLRTDRYRELIDFYCDVLGCTLERETSDEVGLTQLRAGDSLIDIVNVVGELGKVGGPSPNEKENNVDHFCLQIEPVGEEALKAYLRDNGVAVEEYQDRYGAQGLGRSIYLKDITGSTVELRNVM